MSKDHPVLSLPFVKDVKRKRSFWHVEPTGDHEKDWDTGVVYALDAIDYMKKSHMQAGFLQQVVSEMPPNWLSADHSIKIGFLSTFGQLACRSYVTAERFLKEKEELKEWVAGLEAKGKDKRR